MTEDEMVGWHHWLDGHECEQALGVGDGQGSVACCSPWGHKESDTTEWLNNKHNVPCESLVWTCVGKYAPTYLDALVCVPASHSLPHGGEKDSIWVGCTPTVSTLDNRQVTLKESPLDPDFPVYQENNISLFWNAMGWILFFRKIYGCFSAGYFRWKSSCSKKRKN